MHSRFSDAGVMLGAAALFFLCGAGLVVVARFWSRARVVQKLKGPLFAAPAPFVGPAWIDGPARWVASQARPILNAAAVLQVVVLVGLVVV